MNVVIQGDGVAAYCCAHLLKNAGCNHAGCNVVLRLMDRPPVPAIMLTDRAVSLLRDVFDRPDLLASAPRVRSRVSSWSPVEGPVRLEHSAVVIAEQDLLEQLRPVIPAGDVAPDRETWTIQTSDLPPEIARQKRFGSRVAAAVPVQLRPGVESSCCWIESLESGWLFLLPSSSGAGSLLSSGSPLAEQYPLSRTIRPIVDRAGGESRSFPSSPRILSPLGGVTAGGSGWLTCGSAAMGFDPLCGDGAAHAVREAILATAVVRAIAAGGDPHRLLAHYQARLISGFERHLALCLRFYRCGYGGPWWEREAHSLEEGLAWCRESLNGSPDFRYQLRGFDLLPVAT